MKWNATATMLRAWTTLHGVRRLVGALRRVTCHLARARSAPDAPLEGRTWSRSTATSRLTKAVTSHRTPKKSARHRFGVRRQSAVTTALWLRANSWPHEPKRCRATLATALQDCRLQAANWSLSNRLLGLLAICCAAGLSGCQSMPPPGTPVHRTGDEIIAAGQFFHIGTPVVLWTDPGGYDAYRVERRFSPIDESAWETSKFKVNTLSTPNRYGLRRSVLSAEDAERVRGGGWDLPLLQQVVDQFVIHFDASGTSRQCFEVLHDVRGLSVHFMLDLDGTIYQTLDLKERAWHATTSNARSIGIEIANIGAFPPGSSERVQEWYQPREDGPPLITIPDGLGDGGQRRKGFAGRPAKPELIRGNIQGHDLEQYDFTPEQ